MDAFGGVASTAIKRKSKFKSAVYMVSAAKSMSKSSSIFEALKNSETMVSKNPIKRALRSIWLFNLHPHHRFHTIWDVFMLLLVFYSALAEPYKAAFVESAGGMEWYEWAVDGCFYADIIINFFTGFDRGYDMVFDKRLIAKNYLGGWFWVDFFATVEWDLILAGVANPSITSLCRLIKVARLARASRLISRLTASLTINTGFIEAFKFFFYVLLCAHILACLFYMIPSLFTCEKTVVTQAFSENDDSFSARFHCIEGQACDSTCHPDSWRDGLNEGEEYTQSLYWSLTTMTTIGYGDVTPKQEEEIIFVLFAEVLGLAVFALLLTQINNLNEVLGIQQEIANDTKNEIVGFMKWNMLHKTNEDLVERVIAFLNFKSTSHCGHWFKDDDARFEPLSEALKREIKLAMGKPVLKNVKFFGHSEQDDKEKQNVKDLFTSMDADGGNTLDVGEIDNLVKSLGLTLTKAQMDEAVSEMDEDASGSVGLVEFQEWWFTKKYGKPMFPRCSEAFLDALATVMTIQPASPGDVVLECGDYGRGLYIILTGQIQMENVKKQGRPDEKIYKLRTINNDDREPLFGLSAALEEKTHATAHKQTRYWRATAKKFCDLTYVSRADVLAALAQAWPEGRLQLYKIARFFYHLEGTQEPAVQDEENLLALANAGGDSTEERMAQMDDRMGALEAQLTSSMSAINKKLDAMISEHAS